ncbi:hypothetical protein E2C01_030904 [Portunus trituberculatus]|uniref:Protein kinase domain-containing protein n=1 Tax=Portunus trituberculatus TaxID=210409 RepID=A0A5B7EW58_PORTR|nr:hypothetical protein [Portunus trituberculatus]
MVNPLCKRLRQSSLGPSRCALLALFTCDVSQMTSQPSTCACQELTELHHENVVALLDCKVSTP